VRPGRLADELGVARSTLYGWTKTGRWPKPIRLGHRTSGWTREQIEALLRQRQPVEDGESAPPPEGA
jgi:predicted DNA-binding transcriptional regulator AlpA